MPFASSTRQFCIGAGVFTVFSLWGSSSAFAATVAAIQTASTSGMAPWTVHVHGLNSALDSGDETSARYEWTFGDPSGQFNTLVGWNAAHLYEQPGIYVVTLKVTSQNGQVSVKTMTVTVAAASRPGVYVSPSGNDSNSGSSPSAPVQTIARANQLLGNGKAVYFERGATFNESTSLNLTQSNVRVGAYGSGAKPVLKCTSSNPYAALVTIGGSANDVVVQDLDLTSIFTPSKSICRGTAVSGVNVTVHDCHFGQVSYATVGDPTGFLLMNNAADVIGAYFAWCEGDDETIIGNTVAGSVEEHNIRLGGAHRLLIAHNTLNNNTKSTIWCMLGDHAYIRANTLTNGVFSAGPNYAISTPAERFPYLVFERNRMVNKGVIVMSGAEHMDFRNNVFNYDAGECFSIWGYYAAWDRTVNDVVIANNTGVNNSAQYGKFVKLGIGAQNIVVTGNLYCAPSLNLGAGGNVVSDDSSLATQQYSQNLWAKAASGSSVHKLANGGQTIPQWDSYAETSSESYRQFAASDLNAAFVPQFAAQIASPSAGVVEDYYGNLRPVGLRTAGAVEAGASPPREPGDTNGDGVVNIDDLFQVVNDWGACAPASGCPGDLSHDGYTDIDDLFVVINDWG